VPRWSWIGGVPAALVFGAAIRRVPLVTRLTPEPRAEELTIGGVETTLLRPWTGGPWPALALLAGATPLGRRHPRVENLARALARAGHLVHVPDVPGMGVGEIAEDAVSATVDVALVAAQRPDALEGRVGFVGISVGGTLALLAAETPGLAERISVVACIAPYTDLVDVIRLATTGHYLEDGSLRPYESAGLLALSVARSVCLGLPPGPQRDALVAKLVAVEPDEPEPLSCLRGQPTDDVTKPALDLLLNREPDRFDALYAALPLAMREAIERLSPVVGAARLQAPVELVWHPRDKYFPLAHGRRLAAAASDVRLTVTSALAHADASASLRGGADVLRFVGFVVRTLAAARWAARNDRG
jgi:pimeloyl-ACP methyl ester carboxylesterase